MARPASCPKCAEELNIPDEFYGKNVRCAGCGNVFTPSEQAEAPKTVRPTRDDDDDDLPTRRSNRDDDFEDRPRRGSRRPVRREMRSAPRGRSGAFWIWLTLGGLFSVCALGCIGAIGFGIFMDNPKLVPYDSPDGAFHAGFPDLPVVATTTDEKGRTKTTYEKSRKLPQETFFVHVVELKTKPTAAEAEALLTEVVDAYVAKRSGSTEIDREPTNLQGYPAVEVEIEHPDNSDTFVRVIIVGKRIYFVGISGQGLVPESQRLRLFWDEFRIKDAEAAGKADEKVKPKDAVKEKTTEKSKDKTKPAPKPKPNEPEDL